jgi:hypothetical protein
MASLPDPFIIVGSHTMDPHISHLVHSYKKMDPSPDRIQPIHLDVLHQACSITQSATDPTSLAAADPMWTAFFFLLCPGKNTDNTDSAHPFTKQINPLTASLDSLRSATFGALIFSNQKNAVHGEVVRHGLSGHQVACPFKAIVRHLQHLCSHDAAATTPLLAVGPTPHHLKTNTIIKLVRQGSTVYTAQTSNPLPPIHLKALCATGATALLGRDVQASKIQLIC